MFLDMRYFFGSLLQLSFKLPTIRKTGVSLRSPCTTVSDDEAIQWHNSADTDRALIVRCNLSGITASLSQTASSNAGFHEINSLI